MNNIQKLLTLIATILAITLLFLLIFNGEKDTPLKTSSTSRQVDSTAPQQVQEKATIARQQQSVSPSSNNREKTVNIAGHLLVIANEFQGSFERSDYGNHKSKICKPAPLLDAYTSLLIIDDCQVDHVISLKEAHQSGGYKWNKEQKRRFSQYAANHIATKGCVNQSKGAHDVAEWKHYQRVNTTACKKSGYQVNDYGRCIIAQITVQTKAYFQLTVNKAEANVLQSNYLSDCGQSIQSSQPAPQAIPSQTNLTCTHWHKGHDKHRHPGTNHDGTHKYGKCADF